MSSNDSPHVENEALLQKVAAIENEVAVIEATVHRARVTRLVLFCAALAFVAVAVWMFYRLAIEFKSPENLQRLAAAAKDRVNMSSSDYIRHVQALRESCVPVLTEAFASRAKTDLPNYTEAISNEYELLAQNLQARALEKIKDHYHGAGQEYVKVLQQEFPEVDDPEVFVRMNENIDKIVAHLIEKYYSEPLRDTVVDTYDAWDHFSVADAPETLDPRHEEMGDLEGFHFSPLAKQLIGNLLDLVKLKLEKIDEGDGDTEGNPATT